jgi:hypothetical protein
MKNEIIIWHPGAKYIYKLLLFSKPPQLKRGFSMKRKIIIQHPSAKPEKVL